MGVIIKSTTDGFRRGGIAHRAKGTYYPDGALTEQQLAMMRVDPGLLVVEGVQEGALQVGQDNAELVQEMRNTIATMTSEASGAIAALERDLEQVRAGLMAASSDLVAVLAQHQAAPGLIVEAAKLLTPADPAQEGAICILADSLAALVIEHLRPHTQALEAQDHGRNSTLDSAGNLESSPSPAPFPAVAPATGDKPEAVTEKAAGKRGAASKKGAE
ncbi:hypothetical protein LGQ10_29785 [Pseudomonas sp. L5B5]|uniref:HI1506-related protein n=1 Tax=Pseudomonas sp. L5B5 TaxID=2883205 RepID=UPI001CFAAB88|nr:HI1506-related protein [Pseudomonas sp. L5B5]UCZ84454.1 hypothetical protein LGQ10_29785 [Pseudomonas sp. L5B5]